MSEYIPMPRMLRFFLHSHLWKVAHVSIGAAIFLICQQWWDYPILLILYGLSFWAMVHGIEEDAQTFKEGKPQECNCWLISACLSLVLLGIAALLIFLI